jgi:hypothetical protein
MLTPGSWSGSSAILPSSPSPLWQDHSMDKKIRSWINHPVCLRNLWLNSSCKIDFEEKHQKLALKTNNNACIVAMV